MITQIELDKKMSQVHSKLKFIKEESISFKSPYEIRGIYNEIKRIKEEERQRLEKEMEEMKSGKK
jgi:hypothetical protein